MSEGVSYFGVTIDEPDGTIAVEGDQRFDPSLRYRENANGDFVPVGPRLSLSGRGIEILSALGGGENVPAVTCPRCEQRHVEGRSHRCSRVLKLGEMN